MSDVVKILILAAASVTAVGTIGGAVIWLVKPRLVQAIRAEMEPMKDQVAETHKQVTENHHSNEQPTILDILSDLRTDFREGIDRVDKRIDDHLLTASKADADMWRAIEAIAKNKPPEGLI